jgi:hypothetical protein
MSWSWLFGPEPPLSWKSQPMILIDFVVDSEKKPCLAERRTSQRENVMSCADPHT